MRLIYFSIKEGNKSRTFFIGTLKYNIVIFRKRTYNERNKKMHAYTMLFLN